MPPRFFSAACVWQVHGLPIGPPRHQARHSCPPSRTNVPNDLAVNGTRDAVLQLEVHLGDGVLGKDRGVRDVTCGSRLLAGWTMGRTRLDMAAEEELRGCCSRGSGSPVVLTYE